MTLFLIRRDNTCGRMEITRKLTHLPVDAREAEKAILDALNSQEGEAFSHNQQFRYHTGLWQPSVSSFL